MTVPLRTGAAVRDAAGVTTTLPAAPDTLLAQADLLLFVVVGLLAGAHCLGMCGPLVTAYADRMQAGGEERRGRGAPASRGAGTRLTTYEVRQHALFNLSRTASYALLGAGFGALGAAAVVSVDAVAAGGDALRGLVGVLVGTAVVASGVYYLRGRSGALHDLPVASAAFGRITGLLAARIDRLANSPGVVLLGGLHGLMPCPILYPAYLYAFALGDPVRGALSLGALGLGTVPTLLAYGTLLGSIDASTRLHLHRVLGVAFLLLGYVPLQHGLALYGIHLPQPPIPFYQPL